ncbi:MAG: Rrf2 family transcriptional regulator [candidate division NC10 bacterium]|nr:Rrf2 family transcriptional regulator [candidate division NC10 bacterium]
MHLSRHADYALRIMLDLAAKPSSHIGEIARRKATPPAFSAKIVRDLVRAGLVKSIRGRKGGVSIAREPSAITLLQVIEAVDGPLSLALCVHGENSCPLSRSCPARPLFLRLQRIVTQELKAVTLEDLVTMENEGEKGGHAVGGGNQKRSGKRGSQAASFRLASR